tara:strand:+ start:81 stop:629 length:549 start_codon:yes stop_codon:yes gene_type:complete
MQLKIKTLVNFNFNKTTGAAFKSNFAQSLEDLAKAAKKIVKKTFTTQRDIDGKKFASSTSAYLNMKHKFNQNKIKSNKIMTDTGTLKKSIEHHTSQDLLESVVGTPLGKYEKHLEDNISGIIRDKSVYKGYRGDFAPIPQRKFFFTSDEEAMEKLKPNIDKAVDDFFEEFIKNLSTSMRKLN